MFHLFTVPILQAIGTTLVILGVLGFFIVVFRHLRSGFIIGCFVLVIIGGALMLFVGKGLPQKFSFPFQIETYGPKDDPGIPYNNMVSFFNEVRELPRVREISQPVDNVPAPITRDYEKTVAINITAEEVLAQVAPGVTMNYWTYDGRVPGPLLRVREGDTVELTLNNAENNMHTHNIDLHAVTGPGGGAAVTNVEPGESKTVTFEARHPGLFVYHCAKTNVATHMAHGMYGLILVEPKEGLAEVDHEYYVMQGELYPTSRIGTKGLHVFDAEKMLDEQPEYVVFNGTVPELHTGEMKAEVGDDVRMYVGNGGVNFVSSFHMIGEVFETVYPEASLTAEPHTDVQTTMVPAGGASVVEFGVEVPGDYVFVDHALARLDRGAWGVMNVTGPASPSVFHGE